MVNRNRGFGLLVYLAMVPGILGAIGAMAYKVRQSGYDAAMRAVEEGNAAIRRVQQAKIEKAVEKLEDKKEKTRVIYRTITKEVDKIVVRYADKPCLDPDGVRAASDALTRTPKPTGKPDAPLPPTNPVR